MLSVEMPIRRICQAARVVQRRRSSREVSTLACSSTTSTSTRTRRRLEGAPIKTMMITSTTTIARRNFARSSGPTDETPEDKAESFVRMVGYDARIAKGVVDALVESGLRGEALLATVRSMAGRWEVGEDEGLEALVGSVQQHLALTVEGKKMVKIWCVPPGAWASGGDDNTTAIGLLATQTDEEREAMMTRAFPVECVEGTSLTDVAKFGEGEGASTLGEYLECACSGIMACSTCHVVIDPDWFEKVGEPVDSEQDMLDLSYNPKNTSRLGCQIVVTNDLNGLVVRMPSGANNLMDYVPFED